MFLIKKFILNIFPSKFCYRLKFCTQIPKSNKMHAEIYSGQFSYNTKSINWWVYLGYEIKLVYHLCTTLYISIKSLILNQKQIYHENADKLNDKTNIKRQVKIFEYLNHEKSGRRTKKCTNRFADTCLITPYPLFQILVSSFW